MAAWLLQPANCAVHSGTTTTTQQKQQQCFITLSTTLQLVNPAAAGMLT
jgi:hypothetical protein